MEGFHNLSRPEYRHRPPAMSNVLVHLQDWANREKKQMVNPFISQMGETEAQSGTKPGRSDSQKELAGEGWGGGWGGGP